MFRVSTSRLIPPIRLKGYRRIRSPVGERARAPLYPRGTFAEQLPRRSFRFCAEPATPRPRRDQVAIVFPLPMPRIGTWLHEGGPRKICKSFAEALHNGSRMLMFREKIPADWVPKVLANLPAVLVDHAHLERKAATSALNLEKHHALHSRVDELNAIAIEELQHFQLVLDLLKRRA